ncbi:MAG: ATP-binding protein, partial [Ginsengibacter sp.]
SNQVIQYYTDVIFRLNTLTTEIPGNTFLKSVYQDVIAQRTLSQMITYFAIIRTNVFNILFTKQYMLETLFGTLDVYKVYKTYETEFMLKAAPASVIKFKRVKNNTELKISNDYLDSLFTTFRFDSAFNATRWWNVSTNSMIALREQQSQLWNSVDTRMNEIYQQEKNSKNETLVFLFLAVALATLFVSFIVMHIHNLLKEIKGAATKISKGGSGLKLINMPKDIIGDLAGCIINIDKNNLTLARAANQIGKGNFDVEVKLRSEEDLLGISIQKMKNDLQQYTLQKDKIQKESEDLIYRRDEFFSIASHELKTPITSLKAYTQLLLMDAKGEEDSQQRNMLERMDLQINKLTALINDLLDSSKVESGRLVYNKESFLLKDLVVEIIEDVMVSPLDHEIIFNSNSSAEVFGDRDRIGQVISNFLTNAIKYSSECKKIIVSLKEENNKVICSVKDFGKGIVIEEQDKIFERFYRISGHNLNTFPGLGLGLFICKDIIRKHDGEIGLESEKGKGSTFYFKLPVIH